MPPLKTQVTCPNCRLPILTTIEQVFDVTHDPSAKQRFLSGRFNIIHCPNCHYQGQAATPILYHDADKELFLSYVPMELNLPPAEQEKALGRLMQEVINRLPQEKRKGYLLNPRPAITLQGMIDRVLESEGITREMRQAQQAKLQLAQKFLNAAEEDLPELVKTHDAELDAAFFQVMAAAIEASFSEGNQAAAERMVAINRRLLELSSFGARIQKQRQALETVHQELQALGDKLTQDKLLELILQARDDDKVSAYVTLTRPALDYAFFEALSRRLEKAQGAERERLTRLRETILQLTQQIDRLTEAHLTQAAALLRHLLDAPDLKQALSQNLSQIDDTFMAVLNANLQEAQKAGRTDLVERLEVIGEAILAALQEAAPPEIRFVNELLQMPDENDANAALKKRADEINPQMIDAMNYIAERLHHSGQTALAQRLERLREIAAGELMAANWKKATPIAKP